MILTNLLLTRFWTGATPVPAATATFGGTLPTGIYALLAGFGAGAAVVSNAVNPLLASVGRMMRR